MRDLKKSLEGLSTEELVAKYNGKFGTTLKAPGRYGRSGLVERLATTQTGAVEGLGKTQARKAKAKAKAKPVRAEAEGAPETIRSFAEGLLLLAVAASKRGQRPIGLPYAEVLAKVRERFPGAKTTTNCLRWYTAKLNKRKGVVVPARPRQQDAA